MKNTTFEELVYTTAEAAGISQAAARRALNHIIDRVREDVLTEKGMIRIPRLGTFFHRDQRGYETVRFRPTRSLRKKSYRTHYRAKATATQETQPTSAE